MKKDEKHWKKVKKKGEKQRRWQKITKNVLSWEDYDDIRTNTSIDFQNVENSIPNFNLAYLDFQRG